jgi:hypothetical protein
MNGNFPKCFVEYSAHFGKSMIKICQETNSFKAINLKLNTLVESGDKRRQLYPAFYLSCFPFLAHLGPYSQSVR